MAYSWDVVKTQYAEPTAVETSKNLVIIANGYNEFQKNFIGGNGTTINISAPDPGTVTIGAAAMDLATTGNRAGYKSVTLSQNNTGVSLTGVQSAHDIKDEQKQLIAPRAANLASAAQIGVADMMLAKAGSAVVVTATKEYLGLAKGVQAIRATRFSGEVCGALNPMTLANILDSGIKNFMPDQIQKDLYQDLNLGTFATAKWNQTPDIQNYTYAAPTAVALTGAITFTSGVATTVALAGSTLTGTVKAGTIFTIPTACFTTDIITGNSTGNPYVFTVAEDVLASGNAATVTLTTPLYTTFPNKNISLSGNLSATSATLLLTNGKTYARGLSWAKPTLLIGEASIDDYYGFENYDVKDYKGINIKFSRGSSIADGVNYLRMETLLGAELKYNQMVTSYWFEL